MSGMTDREALEAIARCIDSYPDHPWIPGAAISPAIAALEAVGVVIPSRNSSIPVEVPGRNPRQVAQELAEFERVVGPTDPTGIDCAEAYEGAEDQG